ncbi:MAG: ABC transporter ATP-binding protein, partial [Saprospiraceae bacterium]|nr:ABC transporter ATP-binding protein [Saprospiraceae bacterium]
MPEHLMLLRQFFYPRRSLLFMSLTLDLLASISTIALPVMASQAFAILLGFNSMRWRWMSDAAAAKDFSVILIATASVLLAKTSLEYLRMRLHGRIGEDWSFWLRNRIFQHQLTIDLQYYEDKGIGRYLLRYSGDLGSAQQFVTRGILQFAADLTLLILGIVVIFLLNPYLGGVVGMSLLVWLFVVSGINHMAGKSETVKQNNKSELLAFVNLRLLNMASVKFLNRETGEIRQFERKSEHIRQSGLQYAHWKALAASINTFGVYAIFLLVLWVISVQQHTNPEILSANTFAVMMLLLSLRSLFGRAFQVGLIWKKGGISLKKIAGLLSLPAEPGRTPVEKMTVPVGPLVFREVSHCMAGQQIFNNLSFTLLPGSTGLLHGTTGTGKTVLTKLIAGL